MSVFSKYAGLYPNYQRLGEMQGQAIGGGINQILSALAQIVQKNQMNTEADQFFNPTVTSTTPQQTVGTDLLGKPITAKDTGAGALGRTLNQPVWGNTVMEAEQVNRSQNPFTLMQGLMNANPEIQRRAQAGIQGIQLQQPNFQSIPEGGTILDQNRLSPTFGQVIRGQQQHPKLPSGFPSLTPEKQAEVFNSTYGTNYTAKDFTDPNDKPNSSLLRTEKVTEGGKTKAIDIYGYIGADGKEVITNKSYQDFTPNASTLPEALRERVAKQFDSDPNVRKMQSAINGASTIIELLDENNPVADNSIPTFMARASGEVGNLSEADKAPFGGSSAILQSAKRISQKAMDGTLDDTDRQYVRGLAAALEKAALKNIDKMAQKKARQIVRINKSLKYEDVYSLLSPTAGLEEQSGGGDVLFEQNGATYKIPANEVDDFLKDNPNAKRK